jgi:hypothetical protein
METTISKTKTYSLELTESQMKRLESALFEITDQSRNYGVFENNLISDMAFSYIDLDEAELIEPIMDTVKHVSSTFLAIEKNSSLFKELVFRLMELRNTAESNKIEITQN